MYELKPFLECDYKLKKCDRFIKLNDDLNISYYVHIGNFQICS